MESNEATEELRRFKAVLDACEPRRMSSLYQVTTYKCEREDSDGKHQDITIEVRFDGNYHVEVSDGRGRVAWGGHAQDFTRALETVGWDDLDRDFKPFEQPRSSPGSMSIADG
ncbi:MAG TPA: hypothetical protein VGS16_13720 [Candidatus Dormibacteraeota bacterium]|nr:hypothetical protein [Candidatus Dormibacteraeota bacterium]